MGGVIGVLQVSLGVVMFLVVDLLWPARALYMEMEVRGQQ